MSSSDAILLEPGERRWSPAPPFSSVDSLVVIMAVLCKQLTSACHNLCLVRWLSRVLLASGFGRVEHVYSRLIVAKMAALY